MLKKNIKYNKAFRKDYKKLFKKDPISANMMLLFMDMADKNGRVIIDGNEEEQATQISNLMNSRFNDPTEYQL